MNYKKISKKGIIKSGFLQGEQADVLLHSETLLLLATESGHHVLLPPSEIEVTEYKKIINRDRPFLDIV